MMLSPQGEPLLADFGVVTLVRPNAGAVTDPADLAHVAPELLDGEPASPASDLYSLTSALFTLFNGLPAYVRPGEQSIIPVIKRIASDPLPDLSAKNVPAPVVDALTRGMAKHPADRQHNAQDLGRSLQQAQVALGLPMTEMVMLGSPAATTSMPVTRVAPAAAAAPPPAAPPVVGTAAFRRAQEPHATDRRCDRGRSDHRDHRVLTARGGGSNVVAPSSSSGTTTTRRATTTTTSTTDTTLPADGSGTALATNDGGQIEVNAPTTWVDHDGTPTSAGAPHLQISTDLAEFSAGTYLQPGIELVVLGPDVIDPTNPDAALDAILNVDRTGGTLASICGRGTRTDFTPNGAGLAAARLERLTACGGGGEVIIAEATDTDQTFTILLEVHVGNPPDDAGVDDVMKSFNVVKFP